MRQLTILFILFTLISDAQESKPRFWEKMNMEMNFNLTNYTYDLQYTYPTIDQTTSKTSKDIWCSSDIGFNYRNRFFIVGINAHLFNTLLVEPKVGFNGLFALKKNNLHIGPFISFGKMLATNQFDAKQFLKVGGEIYFKTLHFSVSHSSFSDFKVSQSQVYSMKGLTVQVGKSVAVKEDLQTKSPFLTQLYFESNLSLSPIFYDEFGSFTATGGYFSDEKSALSGNLDVGFSYRTTVLKTGINFSINGLFVGVNGSVNLLSSSSTFYLGPYVHLGKSTFHGSFNTAQQQTEFGLETYIKKRYHLALGYNLYSNYKTTNNQISDMKGVNFKLGYAIPFGKKSTAKP